MGFFEFAEQIMSLTPKLRSEFVEIMGEGGGFCSYPPVSPVKKRVFGRSERGVNGLIKIFG
jgi:hypothetical protein